jgi:hypothetical protein
MLRTAQSFRLLLTGLMVAASACASTAKPTVDGQRATARKDPSVMDSTDLRNKGFQTLYDAIAGQRGDWLIPRGGVGPGGQQPTLGVFIGTSVRSMGVDYLRAIRPADVATVRRLSQSDALHNYNWPWTALVITPR